MPKRKKCKQNLLKYLIHYDRIIKIHFMINGENDMEILKLKPIFKDYIWGGNRLREEFGFESEYDIMAEGWMLAARNDGENTVIGGEFDGQPFSKVINDNPDYLGANGRKFPFFPLLIKLIDAKNDLSVQVHPNDEYAMKAACEFGKTECWYILDCDEGAELIFGFNKEISKEEFRKSIEEGTFLQYVNREKVKKGDLFFIEAGTLHAIGKGILLAEIQQNSNLTYRVYDYGRLGADGKPRPLHIENAIDVTDCVPPKADAKGAGATQEFDGFTKQPLVNCNLFTVDKYTVHGNFTLTADDTSFLSLLITDGNGKIGDFDVKKGDSLFVPASYGEFPIRGNFDVIVSRV